jgi:multidrug resistance efflux pump
MRGERIVDLRDVGEFRQTLAARPPGIVHGTAIGLGLLVAGAIVWASLTEADVVVRAAARVRPADAPLRGFDDPSNENVHAEVAGRIAAITVAEGQRVAVGDVLVRLDTERIENEIARLATELDAKRAELAAVDRMIALIGHQLDASQKRGDAEVRRAKRSVSHSRQRRRSDRRLARVELDEAQLELERSRRLVDAGAGAPADVDAAEARLDRARARLAAAGIGVDDGEPEVLRRSIDQARTDHQVKVAELERQRAIGAGELAAGDKRLANLELERTHATLVAHRAGIVTLGGLAAGDLVAAGKLPLAITDDGALRIDAAISTTDIAEIRTGMRVRVRLAALDHTRYGTATGAIAHVAADTTHAANGATYYLASITLDRDTVGTGNFVGRLKPGMTGELEAITRTEPLIVLLARSIRGAISL